MVKTITFNANTNKKPKKIGDNDEPNHGFVRANIAIISPIILASVWRIQYW